MRTTWRTPWGIHVCPVCGWRVGDPRWDTDRDCCIDCANGITRNTTTITEGTEPA